MQHLPKPYDTMGYLHAGHLLLLIIIDSVFWISKFVSLFRWFWIRSLLPNILLFTMIVFYIISLVFCYFGRLPQLFLFYNTWKIISVMLYIGKSIFFYQTIVQHDITTGTQSLPTAAGLPREAGHGIQRPLLLLPDLNWMRRGCAVISDDTSWVNGANV